MWTKKKQITNEKSDLSCCKNGTRQIGRRSCFLRRTLSKSSTHSLQKGWLMSQCLVQYLFVLCQEPKAWRWGYSWCQWREADDKTPTYRIKFVRLVQATECDVWSKHAIGTAVIAVWNGGQGHPEETCYVRRVWDGWDGNLCEHLFWEQPVCPNILSSRGLSWSEHLPDLASLFFS